MSFHSQFSKNPSVLVNSKLLKKHFWRQQKSWFSPSAGTPSRWRLNSRYKQYLRWSASPENIRCDFLGETNSAGRNFRVTMCLKDKHIINVVIIVVVIFIKLLYALDMCYYFTYIYIYVATYKCNSTITALRSICVSGLHVRWVHQTKSLSWH